MGEYATRKSDGERIKIGTCEDMYYMRFDQRRKVKWESGNVDPVKDAAELRFRFPWPEEDQNAPGDFEDYHKAERVYGYPIAEGVDHYTIQFKHEAGYLVSLPCPESAEYVDANGSRSLIGVTRNAPIHIHRNGFNGGAALVAQRYRPGIGLVPVLKCKSCGAMWRVEGHHDIEALAVAIRSEADSRYKSESEKKRLHTIADRVLAGILEAVEP